VPLESHTKWILEPKPPLERPSAWSSGSPWAFFLSCPGCRPMRPGRGRVHVPLVPTQQAILVELQLQGGQQVCKSPVVPPSPEPPIHRLPRAMALRDVTPRRPAEQHPKNTVEDLTMRPPRATLHRLLLREQQCYPFPLLVAKFISSHPQVYNAKTSRFPPESEKPIFMRHYLANV
jgi:hypothetical protein